MKLPVTCEPWTIFSRYFDNMTHIYITFQTHWILQDEICHEANFVATGDIGSCHNGAAKTTQRLQCLPAVFPVGHCHCLVWSSRMTHSMTLLRHCSWISVGNNSCIGPMNSMKGRYSSLLDSTWEIICQRASLECSLCFKPGSSLNQHRWLPFTLINIGYIKSCLT